MEDFSAFTEQLRKGPSGAKLLVPSEGDRPGVQKILRVYEPGSTFIVLGPPEEVKKFYADKIGYTRLALDLCTQPGGAFAQMRQFGLSVATHEVLLPSKEQQAAYMLVEDLPFSRPNGFFLADHTVTFETVHTEQDWRFYLDISDRLYCGMIGYVLNCWEESCPVLWDMPQRSQFYVDRATGELVFYDLDPYLCDPRASIARYIETCGGLFTEAHLYLYELSSIGRRDSLGSEQMYPQVIGRLGMARATVEKIVEFVLATEWDKRATYAEYLLEKLTALERIRELSR